MPELNEEVERLVSEFQHQVGLRRTDALRSAFVALALKKQWSKAQIARYLGVSRARIGQKVSKFRGYSEMPLLAEIMSDYRDGHEVEVNRVQVNILPDQWEDEAFATRLLNSIAAQ